MYLLFDQLRKNGRQRECREARMTLGKKTITEKKRTPLSSIKPKEEHKERALTGLGTDPENKKKVNHAKKEKRARGGKRRSDRQVMEINKEKGHSSEGSGGDRTARSTGRRGSTPRQLRKGEGGVHKEGDQGEVSCLAIRKPGVIVMQLKIKNGGQVSSEKPQRKKGASFGQRWANREAPYRDKLTVLGAQSFISFRRKTQTNGRRMK